MKYILCSILIVATAGCGNMNSSASAGNLSAQGSGTSATCSSFDLQSWPIAAGAPFPADITLNASTNNGEISPVVVDTGSVYTVISDSFNDNLGLTCANIYTFSYELGSVDFCPQTLSFQAELAGSTNVASLPSQSGNLQLGAAQFSADFPGPFYAILGLAPASAAKSEPLKTTMEQLTTSYLSFEFPNGLSQDGVLSFCPLTRSSSVVSHQIPLVDPSTNSLALGYGYTSQIQQVDFYSGSAQVASLLRSNGNIYYEDANGNKTSIASELFSFYDTGTTQPFFILSQDQSGNSTTAGSNDTLRADKLVISFTDVNGKATQLSQDLTAYNDWLIQNSAPPVFVPQAADFSNATTLIMVLGLNFIGNYDFQFAFNSQQLPTSVRFFERSST